MVAWIVVGVVVVLLVLWAVGTYNGLIRLRISGGGRAPLGIVGGQGSINAGRTVAQGG